MITNEAVLFGILMLMLGGIFYTYHSDSPFFKRFYHYCPALLLCYFLPSLLTATGIVDGHGGEHEKVGKNLYYVASRFLLPASLVLLLLSVDLQKIKALGWKAVIMFLTGTVGIMLGGPITLLILSVFAPEWVGGHGPDAVWRGMTTVAGSWIGGGANQAAMKEIFTVGDKIFSSMVVVDVLVANVWMAVLLTMAARSKELDEKMGADTSAIEDLKQTVEHFQKKHARIPELQELMYILAISFGIVSVGHLVSAYVAPMCNSVPFLKSLGLGSGFFWLIFSCTLFGFYLSTTPLKKLEGAGASKVGSVFIYILVATIGLHMDITEIFSQLELFILGGIWMLIHALLMLGVARMIKAPVFYMAVGSQANVGGAASAPVVASAFHPSLAPVGVLLAVFGYGIGTFAAWICGLILQQLAP